MNKNNDDIPIDKLHRIEGIKADILQGKEYDVIALKWDVSKWYIGKIVSEMRKQGEELIRRNCKEWRTFQCLSRHQHIKYYRELMRERRYNIE